MMTVSRLGIGIGGLSVLAVLAFATCDGEPEPGAQPKDDPERGADSREPHRERPEEQPASSELDGARFDRAISQYSRDLIARGREIFRHDTFGSEAFWTRQMQLNDAIAGEKNGGTGKGLSPVAALGLGLKVDASVLPPELVDAIGAGEVDLEDPRVTLDLLAIDAVIGVEGTVENGALTSVGITCALCHTTVDNTITAGIGRRLDGWANRDLDVGMVISLAPGRQVLADRLGVDMETLDTVLTSWGPGKYDAQLLQDGKALRPDGEPAATLIPAAFGMAGHNLHTYTGFGSVPYWNAYVATTQMGGQGTFFDPRLNDPEQYPLAVESGDWNRRAEEDLVSGKLAALQAYQLAIPAPVPPKGTFDLEAAERGEALFNGRADCARCHVPPLFVEPGYAMHTAEEIGIDDFQAMRSPEGRYRTGRLSGLWTHTKGGFYHDGRFATLMDVVDHYDGHFDLGLSDAEKSDLVEYMMSLGDMRIP